MRCLLCVLVLLLSACAGLAGLSQKPEISLAGLDLLELGLFEQRFAMRLRIQNPNEVDLPINGLSFDVELNGQHFAKGLSDKPVTIPRMGEAVLEVTATSNLGSVLKQLRELQKGGGEGGQEGRQNRVDYRMSGRLSLEGIGSIPFERKGDVQMPAFPLLFDLPRKSPSPRPPAGERT